MIFSSAFPSGARKTCLHLARYIIMTSEFSPERNYRLLSRSVLITRPKAAAEAFAERLQKDGMTVYVAPLMEYVPLPADLSPAAECDALVFSSVQAVTMFAQRSDLRHLPVFAVGEVTAHAASMAGFAQIHTSPGDSMSLAGLIRARQKQLDLHKLFHPAGEDTASDLGRMLSGDGLSVKRVTLYKAEFIETIAPDIEQALIEGKISTVTLFSARTAENFVRIMKQPNMKGVSARLEAVCLSQRIAKELRTIKWRAIHVAATPNMNAIIAHLTAGEHAGATLQADPVIAAFGGIRPMAARLNMAPSTVQGWKDRYTIPVAQVDAVLNAAEEDGIHLEAFWRENRKPSNTDGTPVERRRGADRRQTPATFDHRGYVISPNYVGPDRRSGIDRREQHAKRQQERIRKEKVRFMWRTALSGGFITCAIAYVGLFLLMPEYSLLGHLKENPKPAPVKPAPLNPQAVPTTTGSSSFGQSLSHGIEQAGNMAQGASTTAQGMILSGAQSLAQMFANVQQLTGTTAGTAAMQSIMARLKSTMAAAPADRASLNQALEAARQQDPALKSVMGSVQTQDLGAAAMLLALGELRGNLTKQKSFEEDLILLQKFAGDNPEMQASLARLAPYAKTGVLSRERLQQELKRISADIVMAKLRGEDVSVQDKVMGHLSTLVDVQKNGVPVDATKAITAQARQQMDQGDIHGAIATLQQLEGVEAEAAQPWLQQAQNTATANDSTMMIIQGLMSQLTPAGAAQPGMPLGVTDAQSGANGGMDMNALMNGMGAEGGMGAEVPFDPAALGAAMPDIIRNLFGGAGGGGNTAPYVSGGGGNSNSFPMMSPP